MAEFNEKVLQYLHNLENNFQKSGLDVKSRQYTSIPDLLSYGYGSTIYEITINQFGTLLNRLDFYLGSEGYPSSVAIYGCNLHYHYREVMRTNKCFGFDVSSVELEADFVDIYFDEESLITLLD